MKVKVLASGSKGNVTYVEEGNTKILIDIGMRSCYVEEIEWLDYFYRRMMKREFAEQMGIRIRPFTLWNH